jgi:hypothetical protein
MRPLIQERLDGKRSFWGEGTLREQVAEMHGLPSIAISAIFVLVSRAAGRL